MRNGHYCSMDLLVSSLTRQTNLFSGVDISYCTGKYFSLAPRCEVITGMGNFRINPDFRIENFHFKHEISLLHLFADHRFVQK